MWGHTAGCVLEVGGEGRRIKCIFSKKYQKALAEFLIEHYKARANLRLTKIVLLEKYMCLHSHKNKNSFLAFSNIAETFLEIFSTLKVFPGSSLISIFTKNYRESRSET